MFARNLAEAVNTFLRSFMISVYSTTESIYSFASGNCNTFSSFKVWKFKAPAAAEMQLPKTFRINFVDLRGHLQPLHYLQVRNILPNFEVK